MEGYKNMSKKHPKKQENNETWYVLPDEQEEAKLKAMAYAAGLRFQTLAAETFIPGLKRVPTMTGFPLDQDTIDEMARDLAQHLLSERDSVTNKPDLFCQHYTQAFAEGYRFSLYAMLNGLAELFSPMTPEKRYEAAFRFSWEKYTQQSVYEDGAKPDIDMDSRVATIKDIYRQYQALN
jgi:hypothetical protein